MRESFLPSVFRSIQVPLLNQCSQVLVNCRYPSVLFPNKTQLTIDAYQTQLKTYTFLWPPQRLSTLPGRLTWMRKAHLWLHHCLTESWWCLDVYSGMTVITVGYKCQWINNIGCWSISWRKHDLRLPLRERRFLLNQTQLFPKVMKNQVKESTWAEGETGAEIRRKHDSLLMQ